MMFAADPSIAPQWGAGAGALALLSVAIGFTFRNQYMQSRRIGDLEGDNTRCNWRISILVEVLNAHAIPMPGSFWEPMPGEKQPRRRRGRMRDEMGREAGQTRSTWLSALLLGVIFVVGAALVVNTFVVQPLERSSDRIEHGNIRDQCDNRLQGDFFVAIARAFDSPPAPNPERTAAVSDLRITAVRISHSDEVCKDGVPPPHVPTPALSTALPTSI